MRRLILFDVDGTLIQRGDPDHLGAIDHGVHQAFPDSSDATVHQIDYDGKVDRQIAAEVLTQAGITVSAEDSSLDRVFDLATGYYRERWAGRANGSGDLLPGVPELLAELASRPDEYALGVLTGGSRGVVAVKLERLKLSEVFPVGAFGDEVPSRPDLVPLALDRAGSEYGEQFGPERTVIVGDTPHDVDCAHVHGIPCLGVATGKYSEDELRSAGADAVIPTLHDGERAIELISSLARPPQRESDS